MKILIIELLFIINLLLSCNSPIIDTKEKEELLKVMESAYHSEKDCAKVLLISEELKKEKDLPLIYYDASSFCLKEIGDFANSMSFIEKGIACCNNQNDSLRFLIYKMELFEKMNNYVNVINLGHELLGKDSIPFFEEYFILSKMGDIYNKTLFYDSAFIFNSKALELALYQSDSILARWSAQDLCIESAKLRKFKLSQELNQKYNLGLDSLILEERRKKKEE